MENATSDDSVKIDEDLVAALGFEPASDILIVDDALNDDLSISSDDIQVSTRSDSERSKKSDKDKADATAKADAKLKADAKVKADLKAKGEAKLKSDAKNKADQQAKADAKLKADAKKKADAKAKADSKAAKSQPKAEKSKKSNLVDRLNADSKNAAKTVSDSKTATTSKPPKPERLNDLKSDTNKSGSAKTESKKSDSKPDVKAKAKTEATPPPPIAANAVLISEPSPSAYGFSDVQMPDIKGAFARFTRKGSSDLDDATADVVANTDSLVGEVGAATAPTIPAVDPAGTIDARVTSSPPTAATAPATATPATSPPQVVPQPDIQIIETPTEPNVYVAPTKSGRTRIRSRKVRRQIRHIDPWSVLTFSVIFHACVFGALLLASVLVWRFADGAGLIENAESFWAELADKPDFEIDQGVLVRAAAMIAGLMAIASSVLMVLLTVFFNLISDIVGGIRVTVIEEEPVRVTK